MKLTLYDGTGIGIIYQRNIEGHEIPRTVRVLADEGADPRKVIESLLNIAALRANYGTSKTRTAYESWGSARIAQ